MSLAGRVTRVASWVVFIVVAVVAMRDLWKRDEGEIRGKKWMWQLAAVPMVSVFGYAVPLVEVVYLLVGRKR